jgi:3-methylcrotonyl-CoA carboxylase alpha subunit
MGIATVAVYSDADVNALHVRVADEAVHIGASPASESYLKIDAIIAATRRTGADAVHPGYGFLAENAALARAVIDAGLIFVGPPPSVIEQMGSKIEAKRIAHSVGVAVVPGYDGGDQSDARFIFEAEALGYPVMIKASAGGGGKGMRVAPDPAELPDALATARREAKTAFGDDTLMLEKRILRPRHVEIQVFGDVHGNVITLGERECSIQRRHQKIIEETPSTALDDALRQRMCDAALALAEAIGYINAGTVEFILDEDKKFYFLEVNTRLQVEHPVTEMVRGIDLVKLQIEVAEGGYVPQSSNQGYGHAIEARVYAEDPAHGFLPSIGRIVAWNGDRVTRDPHQSRFWNWAGVIIDAGVQQGDEVTSHYDPTIAKVIAFGEGRDQAIRRLNKVLAQMHLLGLRSNIDFLRRILRHPAFVAGETDTEFIDRHPELVSNTPAPALVWMAVAIAKERAAADHAAGTYARLTWRNNQHRPVKHTFAEDHQEQVILLNLRDVDVYSIQIGEASHNVHCESYKDCEMTLVVDGYRQMVVIAEGDEQVWWVGCTEGTWALRWIDPLPAGTRSALAQGSLHAPMPGNIIAIHVVPGQKVAEGDVLIVMEAMKMEHRINAPHAGVVAAVHFAVGQFAQGGALLLEIQPSTD